MEAEYIQENTTLLSREVLLYEDKTVYATKSRSTVDC